MGSKSSSSNTSKTQSSSSEITQTLEGTGQGTISGDHNAQTVGTDTAFKGADLSTVKAEGDVSHLGDHSTIGGDLTNRDYDLELTAEGGSQITFTQTDPGVSEAIYSLSTALGESTAKGTQQVGDALKRQQIGDISKEVLFGLGAALVAVEFMRK